MSYEWVPHRCILSASDKDILLCRSRLCIYKIHGYFTLNFAWINAFYRSFTRQTPSHILLEVEMLCLVIPALLEGFVVEACGLVSGLPAKLSR